MCGIFKKIKEIFYTPTIPEMMEEMLKEFVEEECRAKDKDTKPFSYVEEAMDNVTGGKFKYISERK